MHARTSAFSQAGIFRSLLASLALLAGCTAAPATAPTTSGAAATAAPANAGAKVSEIRVGLLFPTTGSMGYLGTDQAGGVKAAIDYANAHGGVAGAQIKVFGGGGRQLTVTGLIMPDPTGLLPVKSRNQSARSSHG